MVFHLTGSLVILFGASLIFTLKETPEAQQTHETHQNGKNKECQSKFEYFIQLNTNIPQIPILL